MRNNSYVRTKQGRSGGYIESKCYVDVTESDRQIANTRYSRSHDCNKPFCKHNSCVIYLIMMTLLNNGMITVLSAAHEELSS